MTTDRTLLKLYLHNSIISETIKENSEISDLYDPFNVLEFVDHFYHNVRTELEYIKYYEEYLNLWRIKKNQNTTVSDFSVKNLYIDILKTVYLRGQNSEEQRIFSTIDFDNDSDLDAYIPFFVKKLKEYIIDIRAKRQEIKINSDIFQNVGSSILLESYLKSNILKDYTQNSIRSNTSTRPLSSLINTLKIEVDELYSVYSDYSPYIYSYELSSFGGNYSTSFTELSSYINYNLNSLSVAQFKYSNIQELFGTNYISLSSNSDGIVEYSTLIEPTYPWRNPYFPEFPVVLENNLTSSLVGVQDLGYYFTPTYSSKLAFSSKNKDWYIFYENIESTKTYQVTDFSKYETSSSIVGKVESIQWFVYSNTYQAGTGNIKNFPEINKIFGYTSSIEKSLNSQLGISRFDDSEFIDIGKSMVDWKCDPYGNEYGLYVSGWLTPFVSQLTSDSYTNSVYRKDNLYVGNANIRNIYGDIFPLSSLYQEKYGDDFLIIRDLKTRIKSIEIHKDLLVVDTREYTFFDQIMFDYSTGDILINDKYSNYLKYDIGNQYESVSHFYDNDTEKLVVVKLISPTLNITNPSLTANYSTGIVPIIYDIDTKSDFYTLKTNCSWSELSSGSIITTSYSEFPLLSSFFYYPNNIKTSFVDQPFISKYNSDYYITFIGRDNTGLNQRIFLYKFDKDYNIKDTVIYTDSVFISSLSSGIGLQDSLSATNLLESLSLNRLTTYGNYYITDYDTGISTGFFGLSSYLDNVLITNSLSSVGAFTEDYVVNENSLVIFNFSIYNVSGKSIIKIILNDESGDYVYQGASASSETFSKRYNKNTNINIKILYSDLSVSNYRVNIYVDKLYYSTMIYKNIRVVGFKINFEGEAFYVFECQDYFDNYNICFSKIDISDLIHK